MLGRKRPRRAAAARGSSRCRQECHSQTVCHEGLCYWRHHDSRLGTGGWTGDGLWGLYDDGNFVGEVYPLGDCFRSRDEVSNARHVEPSLTAAQSACRARYEARRHCSSRGGNGRRDGCPGMIEKIRRLTSRPRTPPRPSQGTLAPGSWRWSELQLSRRLVSPPFAPRPNGHQSRSGCV